MFDNGPWAGGFGRSSAGYDFSFDRATLVFVPGVADIERVPVQPGEKVWAMSTNDAVIACREGKTVGVETTYCKMSEYVPPQPLKPEDYVTKADLEDILGRILAARQPAPAAPAPAAKGGKKDG